jgi:hypothetical protein
LKTTGVASQRRPRGDQPLARPRAPRAPRSSVRRAGADPCRSSRPLASSSETAGARIALRPQAGGSSARRSLGCPRRLSRTCAAAEGDIEYREGNPCASVASSPRSLGSSPSISSRRGLPWVLSSPEYLEVRKGRFDAFVARSRFSLPRRLHPALSEGGRPFRIAGHLGPVDPARLVVAARACQHRRMPCPRDLAAHRGSHP